MMFGDKLKNLRSARGWTQSQMAEVSGVPLGTIRDLEQNKREPLLSTAQRLAVALGLSLDEFPRPGSAPAEDEARPTAKTRKPAPEAATPPAGRKPARQERSGTKKKGGRHAT